MTELLKRFLNICLLSQGPQDLPHSSLLLRILMVVYFLTGSFSMLSSTSFEEAVLIMMLDLIVLVLFSWFCLQAFKKQARFVQATTALTGVGSIFQLLSWPLLIQMESVKQSGEVSVEVTLLLLIIISWNLAVFAHIFRHAFGIRTLAAFILTLAYVMINVTARYLIFPEVGA